MFVLICREILIFTRNQLKKRKRSQLRGEHQGCVNLTMKLLGANHFGIKQKFTVKITEFNKPYLFADKMLKGAFKSMYHKHLFEENNGETIMTDLFKYEVPFGFIGRLFDRIILKNYMTKFLIERNNVLKEIAEKSK